MRLCQFEREETRELGYYRDTTIVPLNSAAHAFHEAEPTAGLEPVYSLLDLLPGGAAADQGQRIADWLEENPEEADRVAVDISEIELRAPIFAPRKILLLAGNYAEHIEEEGQAAPERAETFPYVFMKPNTTLNDPGGTVFIPRVSPSAIDYECELGVVMGATARHVPEDAALDYVAGYTVINDISDRKYKPLADRVAREKDAFFDWLHGKWHDGFCPVGPCIAAASAIPNPQRLALRLSVNGEARQDGTTGQMIYPVAAIIAFISQSITLQPGDIIATGTPAGVGAATGRFLAPGDVIDASIEGIGPLQNTMALEPD